MTKRGEITGTAAMAAVLLAFVHYWMQPAPMPAAAGVGGGLAAFWLVRSRRLVAMAVGCVVGTAMGMLFHWYSHASEGRMSEPAEGIVRHLITDWLLGTTVAIGVLALSLSAFRAARHRSGV